MRYGMKSINRRNSLKLNQKSWMDKIVAEQELYHKQYEEARTNELFKRKLDEIKVLFVRQDEAKMILQSRTANRTQTFKEWFAEHEK